MLGSNKLAELFVEVGTRDHTAAGMAGIKNRLTQFAGSVRGAVSIPVALAGGLAGAGATKFLMDASSKAGDLNETLSKVGVVFGPQAALVGKFADDMADKFGNVKRETLDAVAAFGQVLQASGMARDASAQMAIRLATLADDLASQDNMPVAEAIQKITSGLVGEAEPLRKHGVLLSEAAMKQQALKMGLIGANGELTEQQKVLARVEVIFSQLNRVVGDHANTLGGLNNQQKKLAGDLENLQTAVGDKLTGPMQGLVSLVYELGGALDSTFGKNRDVQISALGGGVQGLVDNIREAVSGVGGGFWNGLSEGGNTIMYRLNKNLPFGLGEGMAKSGAQAIFRNQQLRQEGIQGLNAQARAAAKAAAGPAAPGNAAPAAIAPAMPSAPGWASSIYGMLEGQNSLAEEWLMQGAAEIAAKKGIKGRIANRQSRIADLEQSQRDRLAQGGVMGDQLSAVQSLQNELLNDLPKQQLDVAKEQLRVLNFIKDGLDNGNPRAVESAGMVLRGPE
jgi:hypothetical protein